MRTLLIVSIITLISCTNKPKYFNLHFANTYKFITECELKYSNISIPKSYEITKFEFNTLNSNINLKSKYGKLKLLYDYNSAGNNLNEFILNNIELTENSDISSIKDTGIFTKKLTSHNYVYVFPIAAGFCRLEYSFDINLDENSCQTLFNNLINEISIDSISNKQIPLKHKCYEDKIINFDNYRLELSEKVVKGEICISKDKQNIIIKCNNDFNFKNCDDLMLYFNELIIPYYSLFENGSILTIVSSNSNLNEFNEKEILLQFIVRKNSDKNNKIGFSAKLTPVYISNKIKIDKYVIEK